jgi:hypothetical protein
MEKSQAPQPAACADRHRFQCPEDGTAFVLELAHATPLETAPHPRWGRKGGIADLHEARSRGLQNRARIHVIAKDANAKAAVADETIE